MTNKDNGGPDSDRKLLEMAAKAAGITIKPVEIKNVEFAGDDRFIGYSTDPHEWLRGWFNPLTDDGDALRLAVALRMDLNINDGECDVFTADSFYNGRGKDTLETTRRAIVRAAAAIGGAM